MTGNHDRHVSLMVQTQNRISDLRDSLGIQTVDRFIQYQKIRFSYQSHGNSEPLPHSKRKPFCLFAPDIGKTYDLQQFIDVSRFFDSAEFAFYFQVLLCCHISIQTRTFDQTSDPRMNFLKLFSSASKQLNFSFCWGSQSADHTQKCCLSRPVSSDETVDRSAVHMDIYMVYSFMFSKLFCQTIRLQQFFHFLSLLFLFAFILR